MNYPDFDMLDLNDKFVLTRLSFILSVLIRKDIVEIDAISR